MDFSLLFFSGNGDTESTNRYHLYLESARHADQMGFSAIWTPERHFHPFGGLYPNPAVTSAALAMITEHIRLRAGSVVLPLNHVARVVEDWAVVDNLSNGRVEISFAPGWVPNDFILAPDNFEARKEIMHQNIETVRKLWRGNTLTMKNGYGEPVEVNVYPRPIQQELPVWLTSRGTRETWRLAGEKGFGILTHLLGQGRKDLADKIQIYRQASKQAGFGPGKVGLMLHTYVTDSLEQVQQRVKKPFISYLKTSMGLLKSLFSSMDMGLDLDKLTADDIDSLLNFSFERYFQQSGLFGTPETCRSLVAELAQYGVDEIACLIDFGIAEEDTLTALKHLATLKDSFKV